MLDLLATVNGYFWMLVFVALLGWGCINCVLGKGE